MFAAIFAMPRSLVEWARLALVFILAAALTAPLAYCEGRDAAKARAGAARAEANVEAMKTDAAATALAAEQRLEDAAEITKKEEELVDAIQQVPDTQPDPVRVRLGCERLRAQGTDTSTLPACR